MSERIKIRLSDYYTNVVGGAEYISVSKEVFEILEYTFRREAQAQYMRDYRNRTAMGYEEGDTEDLIAEQEESVEDKVLRAMEVQRLREAITLLTPVQRERVKLYFFDELTYRQITEKLGVSDYAVKLSVQDAIKKIKKILI